MERDTLLKVSRENAEWLKENYETLKKEYDDKWIVVSDKRIVYSASMFNEIMKAVKKYDPRTVIVEFMHSQQVAMFF
jgi:orotate phosphoribosyltransferase-like protein